MIDITFVWKFANMEILKEYNVQFNEYFINQNINGNPTSLYEPITYILGLGGKRIRPLLVLMGNHIFNGKPMDALPVSYAIELFHNFSLIHDDIMDKAPLRRGQPTVHEKYNMPTAILSGDATLVLAYQYLLKSDSVNYWPLISLFNTTALQVCEGQQLDMDYETKSDTTISDYLNMIALKTSVLLGASLQLGAIVAKATVSQQSLIYEFGKNLGLAFQLQDDYLDSFGNAGSVGKQIGGDIIANKKTFLWLRLIAQMNASDKLNFDIACNEIDVTKVAIIKDLFCKYKCDVELLAKVNYYSDVAKKLVSKLEISQENKTNLLQLVDWLVVRKA
jgi:geranylgeranyl diphosphate synthase type II